VEFKVLFIKDVKLYQMSYSGNIFGVLHELNVSLKGHKSDIVSLYVDTKLL
jgi:hypothetical protein